MSTTRLSSKGQVIIPKSVRDLHGWKEGTEFAIEDNGDSIVLRPKRLFAPTTLDDVVGCAGYSGPRKTIEEMDAGVEAEARKMWRRFSRKQT